MRVEMSVCVCVYTHSIVRGCVHVLPLLVVSFLELMKTITFLLKHKKARCSSVLITLLHVKAKGRCLLLRPPPCSDIELSWLHS